MLQQKWSFAIPQIPPLMVTTKTTPTSRAKFFKKALENGFESLLYKRHVL
jgi:hypothetical protein